MAGLAPILIFVLSVKTKILKITFLGTGTSQGIPIIACNCEVCQSADLNDKRLRASILIEIGEQKIVVDAGPDFRQQMLKVNLTRLDAILLTHEHVDHLFGLDDIRAFNWVQKHPTDIYAEERVQNAIRRVFNYVFANFKYPGIPQMNLHLIENKPFSIGETEVIPVRGLHYKLPVYGFRIGKMAYLTDVNSISDDEKEKLKGLDVFVVNALRKEEHISHFTLDQALQVIDELKPKKAYLTHISHQMGFHAEVSRELPPNIFLASDGLEIDL